MALVFILEPKRLPGLSIDFQPGLTLILGANGLGKTTLITILYRLLTGPYDIPALTARTNLGSASLQPTALNSAGKKIFARRVTDGARDASARLTLAIGDTEVIVQRRLRDLALSELVIDAKSMRLDETKVFQSHIAKLVGVWVFRRLDSSAQAHGFLLRGSKSACLGPIRTTPALAVIAAASTRS